MPNTGNRDGFSSIDEALDDLRAGRMIVVVDDPNREERPHQVGRNEDGEVGMPRAERHRQPARISARRREYFYGFGS